MRLIKDIVPKPSDAVQAMIDGLLEQDARKGFKVDMDTFGSSMDGICYGCAATCAVQKIAGKDLPADVIGMAREEAEFLGFDLKDVIDFEFAIDDLRAGDTKGLSEYYDRFISDELRYPEFSLHSRDWREQLPAVQEYCNKLKAAGL